MIRKLIGCERYVFTASLILLLGFIAAPLNASAASAGSLDSSFDGDGKIITAVAGGNGLDQAQDIAVQPDGKIVVVGVASGASGGNFALVRYNTNGTLDTSFNGTGKVLTQIGSAGGARAVVVQSNGKIIVAGIAYTGSNSGFGLARYNADGTLDTTYGTNGTVVTSFNGTLVDVNDAAQQPDGKMIIFGTRNNGSAADFQLARYNTDGTLDTTFDVDGLLTKDVSGNLDQAGAIIVRGNGKIIPVGLADGQIAVLRYNEDGTPDTTFDGDGVVTTDIAVGNTDKATDVFALPNGKLLVSGYSNDDFALLTYNANGTLDTTFDGDGIVTTDFGSSDQSNGMAVQADGKIVLVGKSGFPVSHSVLARYNADGTLDATFDGDGKVYTTFTADSDYLARAAIQPDGKIVAAGYAINPSTTTGRDFAVARYNAVGNGVKSDFDGDGRSDVSVFRPSNGVWYLQQSTAGFAGIGFGANGDLIAPADYDGDGKTDIAVFRPSNGVWYLQRSQLGFTGISFGASGDIPAPGDFDGDGRADLAVFRPSNGVWYIQQSTNGFVGYAFGANGDIPAASDYDGDGKTDIAVFRPSNGTWYLQRSSLGFTGILFGANGDKSAPGDFDGDGKADLAVFRPSNGVWYLQQSTAGFVGYAFGTNGDAPVAGDYDGDGKADIAVFRPSNGTWYLQRSTQGFTGILFGASGDVPTLQ